MKKLTIIAMAFAMVACGKSDDKVVCTPGAPMSITFPDGVTRQAETALCSDDCKNYYSTPANPGPDFKLCGEYKQ